MLISRRALLKNTVTGSLVAATSIPAMVALTKPAAAAYGIAYGPLSVYGNKLRVGGTNVRLRGVAIGDPLRDRAARPTGAASDMKYLKEQWNANTVRISIQSITWRDNRDALIAPGGPMERDIQDALNNEMFVILCWHTIGWPDGATENTDWYDTSWALCRSFWTDMADWFGTDNRILFELWNEPVSPSYNNLSSWGGTGGMRAKHMELITLIRGRGANNVVLCSGDQNTFDLRGIASNLIPGPNVAYAWHCYPTNGYGSAAAWDLMLENLSSLVPVVTTEWGSSNETRYLNEHFYAASNAAFNDPFIAYANAKGLHWTGWCWHPDNGPRMIDWTWRSAFPFGTYVKNKLALAP